MGSTISKKKCNSLFTLSVKKGYGYYCWTCTCRRLYIGFLFSKAFNCGHWNIFNTYTYILPGKQLHGGGEYLIIPPMKPNISSDSKNNSSTADSTESLSNIWQNHLKQEIIITLFAFTHTSFCVRCISCSLLVSQHVFHLIYVHLFLWFCINQMRKKRFFNNNNYCKAPGQGNIRTFLIYNNEAFPLVLIFVTTLILPLNSKQHWVS